MKALAPSLLLAVLLLAHCGERSAPVGQAVPDGPRQGGEVVIGTLSDVTTFNPYQSSGDAYEMQIYDMLFPTLMVEQADYEDHPPSFAPNLATSWQFSADNRVLTFTLRSDARWSDGRPVTAEDVAFSFRVQKDPNVGSLDPEIKDFISRVEVVDPYTVRFHFTRVYPYQLMDANDGHIVPAHAWGTVPFADWPTTDFEPILVTSGPFRVARHVRDQTLVLERDPAWWDAPRPWLDRLVLRIVPDQTSQLQQLLSGDLHVVEMLPAREAGRVRADPDLELVRYPGRTWGFLAWNNSSPLFSDRRVRRALAMAINRDALVQTVYHGFARVASGPVPSTMWAHNRSLKPLPYDPEGARALLEEAGWRDADGDGVVESGGRELTFDLMYPSVNTLRRDIAVMVQADLARVGVRCRPFQAEYTSFLDRTDSGRFDASLSAWVEATKVDLTAVWSTPTDTTGSSNFYRYSNPEVDRLIAAARHEPEHARARVLLDRAQEHIVADSPVVFLYEIDELVAIDKRVRGADVNSQSPFFNIDEWYLAP